MIISCKKKRQRFYWISFYLIVYNLNIAENGTESTADSNRALLKAREKEISTDVCRLVSPSLYNKTKTAITACHWNEMDGETPLSDKLDRETPLSELFDETYYHCNIWLE